MTRDLLLLLLGVLLTGCVEVEEQVTLGSAGGGTYELRLAWDADLVHRVNEVVGRRVARRFARGALPLDAVAWRESLEGCSGLRAERVEVEALDDGRRELRLRVAFERLEDLVAWEVFGRRSIEVEKIDDRARLRMKPLRRAPPLDRVLDALALWREAPTRSAAGGLREASPAERIGILPADGEVLAELLETELARARFVFRLDLPEPLEKAPGAERDGRRATWRFGVEALGRQGSGGAIDLTWQPRAFDRVPRVHHP